MQTTDLEYLLVEDSPPADTGPGAARMWTANPPRRRASRTGVTARATRAADPSGRARRNSPWHCPRSRAAHRSRAGRPAAASSGG